METTAVLDVIGQLVWLAEQQPGASPEASRVSDAALSRAALECGATGYKAEKLAVVRDGMATWLSARQWAADDQDAVAFRQLLLRNIEHLKKALVRQSTVQD
jgi:DNA-binding MurR/RpiR family transcriptional regulator